MADIAPFTRLRLVSPVPAERYSALPAEALDRLGAAKATFCRIQTTIAGSYLTEVKRAELKRQLVQMECDLRMAREALR